VTRTESRSCCAYGLRIRAGDSRFANLLFSTDGCVGKNLELLKSVIYGGIRLMEHLHTRVRLLSCGS